MDAQLSHLGPNQLYSDRLMGDAGDAAGVTFVDEHALSELWVSLTTGTSRIVEVFATSERQGLIVAACRGTAPQPLPRRGLALLERVLNASQQKVVAIETRNSQPGINRLLTQVLTQMGLSCVPSRLPLLLAVASRAARSPGAACAARVSRQSAGDTVYQSITLQDPTAWLRARLSPAQCRIARLLIDGKTHAEMATLRNISERTVANHLAAIYQRLNVSGRLDLLRRLAEEYVCGGVAAG